MRICHELLSKQYSLLNRSWGVSPIKKVVLLSKIVLDSPTSTRSLFQEDFEFLDLEACVESWRSQEKVGVEGRVPERAEVAFY